jgi:hypothetical protein
MLPHVLDAPKRVPPLILHISFASILPDGLASSQIEIYPGQIRLEMEGGQ